MKNALLKDTFREISKTKSRFVSIAMIVALGTGFFCGIKMTCPDMKDTADKYYEDYNLSDFHIMGNYGITEEDITALNRVDGVKYAVGGYSVDVFVQNESNQHIVKIYSFPTSKDVDSPLLLNRPQLIEGRLPQNANECVVDNSIKAPTNFFVGNTLEFVSGDPDTELSDSLNVNFCNIVGVVKSPMYVNFERGSSQIGNGEVLAYIMMAEENFTYDVYTDAYVALDDSFKYSSFSDEYENLIDEFTTILEDFGEERSEIRFQDILEEANEEILDAEEELADAKVKIEDAEDELADGKKTQATEVAKARKELADARQELEDGQKDYDEAYADYLKEIEDARIEIADAYKEIEENEQKILDGWDDYYEGLAKFQSSKADGKAELKDAQAQVNSVKQQAQQIADLSLGVSNGFLTLDKVSAIVPTISAMDTALGQTLTDAITYAQYTGDTSGVTTILNTVSSSLKENAESGQNSIDRGYDKLDSAEKKLADAKQELIDAEQEIADAKIELADAEKELEESIIEAEQEFADAREELAEGKDKIADAQKTLNKEIAKSNKEIADGEDKIADAWVEYDDAIIQLEDAKQEIADLDEAKWYVLDRTSKPGYGDYGMDAERIDKIAGVFPFFFILIAALVCFTTMTRMVEEQRIQIGTLKALGYPDSTIMRKYLMYAAGASVIGSVIGLSVGFPLFPNIIFGAYSIMYDFPAIETPFHVAVGLGATIVAIVVTTVAAYYAGIKELKSQPSQLMRPKAPKNGKKILLERWTSLWNRVSFSYKVTIRNIARYKGRVALTVIGIGGCTSLMFTGFGLQHSIESIATRQFNDIFHYDIMGAIDGDVTEDEFAEVISHIENIDEISEYTFVYSQNIDAYKEKNKYSTTLFVIDDYQTIDEFIKFQVRTTKEPVELTDDGVIINEKLAKLLGVQIGDSFEYEDNDTVANLLVTGICENYAMNYVYMTPAYYQEKYGEKPEINTFIANMNDLSEETQSKVATELIENDSILGVSFVKEIGDKFTDLLGALNIIVVVLILCAGLLAFIVLYNLTNINVNERIRELATIKVLGFYDNEVSAYIYRENTISSIFGVVVGLLMGIYFHSFVIQTAEVDIVMFDPNPGRMSYVYAGILTMVFTFIVNFALHFRLKKIDMVESLKSVE